MQVHSEAAPSWPANNASLPARAIGRARLRKLLPFVPTRSSESRGRRLSRMGNIAGFPAGVGFRQDADAPFPWPAAEGSNQGLGSSPLFGGTPQTSSPIM